jgi:hypothetical protein
MRRLCVLTTCVAFSSLAFVGLVCAQQSGAGRTAALTPQDRDDIAELYARYNQGSDFSDMAMFMSIWADDAVFRASAKMELVGRKAIEEWRTSANESRRKANAPPRRHFNSSLIITPMSEGAKGRNYWILMDVSGKEPRIYASGYHDDTFVKTANGWKIKTRVDHNDPGE